MLLSFIHFVVHLFLWFGSEILGSGVFPVLNLNLATVPCLMEASYWGNYLLFWELVAQLHLNCHL